MLSCPRRAHSDACLSKYAEGIHMYFQPEELLLPTPSCVLTQVGNSGGRLYNDLLCNALVLAQAMRTLCCERLGLQDTEQQFLTAAHACPAQLQWSTHTQ